MKNSNSIQLVQIDPKVVWDSTESEMLRAESEDQRTTLGRVLDCPVTFHMATRFDSRMKAKRVACAEVWQGIPARRKL